MAKPANMVPSMYDFHADRRLRWYSSYFWWPKPQPYLHEQDIHADLVEQPWWHPPVANAASIALAVLEDHAD